MPTIIRRARAIAFLGTSAIVGLVALACAHRPPAPVAVTAVQVAGDTRRVAFDDMEVGRPPRGFRCAAPGPADAKPARWQVLEVQDAPGCKRVLEQSDGDSTNHRYPVALLEGAPCKDVRVTVQAEAVSGGRDRSFGVVVRAKDERNYYVARANTSGWGENVRFYRFVDGERRELDEWEGAVKPGVWHSLQVDALGDAFTVLLDGQPVLRVRDAVFPDAGLVGVWTKAESVSRFAEILITPLGAAAGTKASP